MYQEAVGEACGVVRCGHCLLRGRQLCCKISKSVFLESFVVRKSVLCLPFVFCSPQLLETVVFAEINIVLVTIIYYILLSLTQIWCPSY